MKEFIEEQLGFRITFAKLLIAFFIIAFFISFIESSENPHPQKQPDYLGSAEEKMNKGLELNSKEQQAVGDALGINQESKNIEKKYGE